MIVSVYHSAWSGGIKGIFVHFLNMKVCCVFSLAFSLRGDSNEYTQFTILGKTYVQTTFQHRLGKTSGLTKNAVQPKQTSIVQNACFLVIDPNRIELI